MFQLLFPPEAALLVEQVYIDDDEAVILAAVALEFAACPQCGTESRRVHSSYQRHPADLPCLARSVRLMLTVRRFFYDNSQCSRRTFAETFPDLLSRRARRTNRLAKAQLEVGLAVGGEAGSRLLGLLAMPISGDTLINDIRRQPEPEVPTPRVLSVDDWAQLKGRRYGSILVDLETHRPVDLLETSSAAAIAGWLREHPGVAIVSRDRSKEYARVVSDGAPTAIQVADRWHLLKNLRESLQKMRLCCKKFCPIARRQAEPK